MAALAPEVPEPDLADVVAEATAAALAPVGDWWRSEHLDAVLPRLSWDHRGQVVGRALEIAAMRAGANPEVAMLVALTPHLVGDELARALQIATTIVDLWRLVRALEALASRSLEETHMETLMQAVAVAESIRPHNVRAWALTALARHLPEPERSETLDAALEAASVLVDGGARARFLAYVCSELDAPHRAGTIAEVLEVASQAGPEEGRIYLVLASALPEPRRAELLARRSRQRTPSPTKVARSG